MSAYRSILVVPAAVVVPTMSAAGSKPDVENGKTTAAYSDPPPP